MGLVLRLQEECFHDNIKATVAILDIFHNSFKEWGFWLMAAFLFVAMVLLTVFSVQFLAKELNDTLTSTETGASSIEHFDFNALNQVLSDRHIAPTPVE